MKKLSLIVLLTAAVVGISVFSTYLIRRDEIASRRHSVEQAWNQVNSAMQRRADLVPTVLASTRVTAARHPDMVAEVKHSCAEVQSAQAPADVIAANRRLDASVSRFFAASEEDPDRLFNQKFFVVQDEWAAASNRIAPERVHYNQAVRDYNAFIAEFPNDIFAHWASFSPMQNYFSAEAGAASKTTAQLHK